MALQSKVKTVILVILCLSARPLIVFFQNFESYRQVFENFWINSLSTTPYDGLSENSYQKWDRLLENENQEDLLGKQAELLLLPEYKEPKKHLSHQWIQSDEDWENDAAPPELDKELKEKIWREKTEEADRILREDKSQQISNVQIDQTDLKSYLEKLKGMKSRIAARRVNSQKHQQQRELRMSLLSQGSHRNR